MASISYLKLKTRNDIRHVLRHCDPKCRMEDEHNNPDIDKTKTHLNRQLLPGGYVDSYNRFSRMIEELDSKPKANKRCDRVECFALNIPFPEEIAKTPARWREFGDWLMRWVGKHYKVVNAYCHLDEVHEYMDSHTHTVKCSRPHVHLICIPEVDGKLCGKKFSAPKQMSEMNKLLDKDIMREFGVHFLTNEEPRKKKVEELKLESYKKLTEDVQKRLEQLHDIKDFESMRKLYLEYYGKAFDVALEEIEHSKRKEIIR